MATKKIIAIVSGLLLVTACEGDKSPKVQALQKKDKNLSCSEVMLEMNEAEFYRRTAEKNKNPKVKNVLMPLGYVSTYIDAEDAIQSADERIDYLNRIYEILDCDKKPAARRTSSPGGYYVPNGYYPTYEEEQRAEPIAAPDNLGVREDDGYVQHSRQKRYRYNDMM